MFPSTRLVMSLETRKQHKLTSTFFLPFDLGQADFGLPEGAEGAVPCDFLLTWERQILAFPRVLRVLFLVQFLPSRLVLLHHHQHPHLQNWHPITQPSQHMFL